MGGGIGFRLASFVSERLYFIMSDMEVGFAIYLSPIFSTFIFYFFCYLNLVSLSTTNNIK